MDTYRSAEQKSSARTTTGRASLTLVLTFTLLAGAQAQDGAPQQPQRENGPPPLRYMPPDVRQRLEGAKDMKARARLCMEIAEERLALAAQLAGEDRFEAATAEIGIYEAIVEDSVRTLHASHDGGKGKVGNKLRDIFKRVEITLRSHVTRLESIRRVLPERHAVYLKDAIDFVRDRRDQALGAFYTDSVIRESHHPELTTPAGERATTNAAAQPDPDKKPDPQQQQQ